jgi:hypothetical protein
MRGDTSPAVEVEVLVDGLRISLLHDDQLIGDWEVGDIGIKSLNDGFAIRAEGEEMILRTEDDVALAREMGMVAASPRMARRLAASQNPDRPMPSDPEPVKVSSTLVSIAFALAGVMVVAGGLLLRADASLTPAETTVWAGLSPEGNFWSAFALGGLLLLGVVVGTIARTAWARTAAMAVIAGLVLLFGLAAQNVAPDADHLLAYGFIAGAAVIGIAMVFAGTFAERE